jgi:BirA family biotin operon repressor/biotin-[acetyl-CoA-carboxylase] ligase
LAGIGIRWPNDVEIGERKLAGLLPEAIETPSGRRILIGIGLNLATCFDHAPPELSRMAVSLTSLGLETKNVADPRKVLEMILDHLGRLLFGLASDDPMLAERWEAADLLRGRRVRIDLGSRILRGLARGIGPDGALRLAPEDGGPVLSIAGGQVLRDRPSV